VDSSKRWMFSEHAVQLVSPRQVNSAPPVTKVLAYWSGSGHGSGPASSRQKS
jgi:hypothetical protein